MVRRSSSLTNFANRETRPLRAAILGLAAKSYGQDTYFSALLPALERYGDDTEFLIFTRGNRYHDLVSSKRIEFHSIESARLKSGSYRIWWEQAVLPGLLSSSGADVVYTANNVGILRSPTPCVIAIRNMEAFVPAPEQASLKLKLRHVLLKRLTYRSIRSAQRVIAVSDFVREHLLAFGTPPGIIDLIYHGVDDLMERPAPLAKVQGEAFAACVAKFIRYANLTGVVQAFARMRELGFSGELRIVGGGYDRQYEAEVRDLVTALGLVESVRFLGYVARAEVQSLMRNCSVFLFPSTLEACPFTLLEAMQQGAPIVATTAKPMPEFCGDAALLADPSDSKAFGDAAYQLATSDALGSMMRARSRARASMFRWETNVAQLTQSLRLAAAVHRTQAV